MITSLPNNAIIAAVQFEPKPLDVRHNLAHALQLTFEAAAKGAGLIVLPELCTSGLVIRDRKEASQVAQTRGGYQTEMFVPICQKFNCHVVFGFVELQEGKLYNSAAIVGQMGVKGVAQKHNLDGSDNLWAEASESMSPLIITRAGRTGALITRDVMNCYNESFGLTRALDQHFYQKGSVDTIALLASWTGDYSFPSSEWVELSEQTCTNVAVANRVGTDRDMHFKGGSCIISRGGRVWTNGSNFTGAAVVGGVALL